MVRRFFFSNVNQSLVTAETNVGSPREDACSQLISEYPHTFTSQLKGQTVVEHDRCEFEIDVEADDAEVSWYKDGKKINVEDGRVEIVVEGKKRKLVIKVVLIKIQ